MEESEIYGIDRYITAKEFSSEDEEKLVRTLAAGGFKDTTRIAASSPEIWRAICSENRENVLEAGKFFIEKIKYF